MCGWLPIFNVGGSIRQKAADNRMQQLRVDFQAARTAVDDEERNTEQYIRQFFNADWKDPQLYDLMIDRGKFSVEKTVQQIAETLQGRTPES